MGFEEGRRRKIASITQSSQSIEIVDMDDGRLFAVIDAAGQSRSNVLITFDYADAARAPATAE
jgi:hypothetical protein